MHTSKLHRLQMSVMLRKAVSSDCGTTFWKTNRSESLSPVNAIELLKCLDSIWDRNRKLRSGLGGDNPRRESLIPSIHRAGYALSWCRSALINQIPLCFPLSLCTNAQR